MGIVCGIRGCGTDWQLHDDTEFQRIILDAYSEGMDCFYRRFVPLISPGIEIRGCGYQRVDHLRTTVFWLVRVRLCVSGRGTFTRGLGWLENLSREIENTTSRKFPSRKLDVNFGPCMSWKFKRSQSDEKGGCLST